MTQSFVFRRKQWIGIASIALLVTSGLYYHMYQNDPARVVATCIHSANKPLCYSSQIEDILRTRGIPAAFDALAVAYDTDRDFSGTCHSVTHELGDAAYQEFRKKGETELSGKASYCGYGFYHGFMDALYVDTNDMEKARTFCTYVGENVPHPPAAEYAEGSCYHGIGHGVTDGTEPQLWGDALAIVKPGLILCAKVAVGNNEWRRRCASGVFNALGNMYLDPKFKLDSGTNPYTICRTGPFVPVEREACYEQMNTQAAELANNSLTGIVGFTETIQDLHYRAIALHEAVSFYIQILKSAGKSLLPEEVNVCELSTLDLKNNCVGGLVGGIVEFGSPGRQYEEVVALCRAERFPADLRASCYSALFANSRYYYTADTVRKICKSVPQEYRNSTCQS